MLIAIAGKNAIAVDVLAFAAARVPTGSLLVVPNRDDLGRTGWQPSLLREARRLGVRVGNLEEAERTCEVFLSCEFDRIVKPARFKTDRLFNIHFSLLPRYRGVATSVWPVLHGDAETGVTLHWIDAGIDTGPVIAQRRFTLTAEATARDVYLENLRVGGALVTDWFEALVHGEVPKEPQHTEGASYFGRRDVDWSAAQRPDFLQPAAHVRRFFQAYSFFEYQLPRFEGRAVDRVEVLNEPSRNAAGTVRERAANSVVVSTADLDVRLHFDQRIALLEAAERDDIEALVGPGEAFNFRGPKGWSPLHAAAYNGRTRAVEVLVNKPGLDVNFTNHRGTNAVMYARSCSDRAAAEVVVRLLLRAGARLDARDEDGRSALDYAREAGQHDFLSWVAGSADVD